MPTDTETRMLSYLKTYADNVTKVSPEQYINENLSITRSEEAIAFLKKTVPFDLRDKRLLEIGSGFGAFVLTARRNHSIDAFGIEPEQLCYDISQELLQKYGNATDVIKNDMGESLSFPDNFFDVVYSTNVLEHVQDPEKVISESIRVLKPGGYLICIVPNYGSWWEGHYGLPWIPHMPKWLAKCYVRLFNRRADFIDGLQFINLTTLKKIMRRNTDLIEIKSWGWNTWEERLKTLRFSEWAALSTLKKILRLCEKLHLLHLIAALGKKLGWVTPIILVGKKRTAP